MRGRLTEEGDDLFNDEVLFLIRHIRVDWERNDFLRYFIRDRKIEFTNSKLRLPAKRRPPMYHRFDGIFRQKRLQLVSARCSNDKRGIDVKVISTHRRWRKRQRNDPAQCF